MAKDAALALTRLRGGALAAEVTTGTMVTMTAAECVVPMFGLKITPDIEPVEIPERAQTGLSAIEQKQGARWGKATWENELYGTGVGATLPGWGPALLACGFQFGTGVAKRLTACQDTLSVANFLPTGKQQALAGCMGSFTLPLVRGKASRFAWEFEGVWQQPKALTLPASITYESVDAPTVGLSTFTIGGQSVVVPEVTIKVVNTIIRRPDATARDRDNNKTGYRGAYIARRQTRILLEPEALAQATHDWDADFLARNKLAFAATLNGGTGNTFVFEAPKLQLINSPADGDRDGLQTDVLELLCTVDTEKDDEFTITLS